jgi:serine/threonine protein phosphatase PrpC
MGNSYSVDSKLLERSLTKDLRIGACGMQGFRYEMEDAHVIVPELANHPTITVCGVFDGHCGSLAAKYVSEHLSGAINQLSKPMDPNQLKQCLVDLDQKFHTEHPENHSGATVALALIQKQANGLYAALFANAGDSRVALVDRRTAEILYMSKDHKPEDKAEMSRIKKAGGQVYNGRVDGNLNLSRSFGDWPYKANTLLGPLEQRISVGLTLVGVENIQPNHSILVYCDGFTETKVPDQELIHKAVQLMEKEQDPAIVAAKLCDSVASNDNMTMMVLVFDQKDRKETKNETEYVPGKLDPKNEELVKLFTLDAINRGSFKADSEELKLFLKKCVQNYSVKPIQEKKEEKKWTPNRMEKKDEKKDEKNSLAVPATPCGLIFLKDPELGYGDGESELQQQQEEKNQKLLEEEEKEWWRVNHVETEMKRRYQKKDKAMKRKQEQADRYGPRYNLRRKKYFLRSQSKAKSEQK